MRVNGFGGIMSAKVEQRTFGSFNATVISGEMEVDFEKKKGGQILPYEVQIFSQSQVSFAVKTIVKKTSIFFTGFFENGKIICKGEFRKINANHFFTENAKNIMSANNPQEPQQGGWQNNQQQNAPIQQQQGGWQKQQVQQAPQTPWGSNNQPQNNQPQQPQQNPWGNNQALQNNQPQQPQQNPWGNNQPQQAVQNNQTQVFRGVQPEQQQNNVPSFATPGEEEQNAVAAEPVDVNQMFSNENGQ